MKSFYIITNLDKPYAREARDLINSWLCGHGADCRMDDCRKVSEAPENVPAGTDCVITIGGDGTLIQAARDLVGRNIPMLGVNRGHLGFLNQVSRKQDIIPVLAALLEDRYRLEYRMMIRGCVERAGQTVFEDIALNEIAVRGSGPFELLHCEVCVNGEYLNEYAADGVLVATPTGSTAYNLSAGGPLLMPASRMMVFTPVCAHALNSRSIVLSGEDTIQITVLDEGQLICCDGDSTKTLAKGDTIRVEGSSCCTVMIKLEQVSFMQNLSNHLQRM